MRVIQIQDIKQGKYQGYLWYSDEVHPRIFDDDELKSIETKENAFVVEGLLWQPSTYTSIRIAYHDGKQYVYEITVSQEDLNGNSEVTKEQFIAHRMPGISHLNFRRYWNLDSDPLCEGFDVLTPGALVFVGFNKNNK